MSNYELPPGPVSDSPTTPQYPRESKRILEMIPRNTPDILVAGAPSPHRPGPGGPWAPGAPENAGYSGQLSSFGNGILSAARSSHVVAPGCRQNLGGHFVGGIFGGSDTHDF